MSTHRFKNYEKLSRHFNLQLSLTLSFGKTMEVHYTSTVNKFIGDIMEVIYCPNHFV
jgi:hypothetical protein